MKKHPILDGAGDGPAYGNKVGKQEDFYGVEAGVGAAFVLGISVQGRAGFVKK